MKVVRFTGERDKLKKLFFIKSTRDLYLDSMQRNVGPNMFIYIRTDNEIAFECNHCWWTNADLVTQYLPEGLEYEVVGDDDDKVEIKEFEHWGNN